MLERNTEFYVIDLCADIIALYMFFFSSAVPVVCCMRYIECYGQVLQCGSNMYFYWDIRREAVTEWLERSLWLWDPGSNISMAIIKVTAWCFWTGKVIGKKKHTTGWQKPYVIVLTELFVDDWLHEDRTRRDRGFWQWVF